MEKESLFLVNISIFYCSQNCMKNAKKSKDLTSLESFKKMKLDGNKNIFWKLSLLTGEANKVLEKVC